jgi:hypothetical protein
MQEVLTLQGGDNGGAYGVYSIPLMFIFFMNLVLKRQSLKVYQARD